MGAVKDKLVYVEVLLLIIMTRISRGSGKAMHLQQIFGCLRTTFRNDASLSL